MHLVTGGLGFIGNELVRQLSRNGQDAVILDNGSRRAERIEDLASLPVLDVDVTDHERVRTVVRDIRPDVVVHLAAMHYIPDCNANPMKTLHLNLEATLNLVRACSDAGVSHFLLASSGAVYADSPDPLSETSPVEPSDIYAWSKFFAEELCLWHAATEGLKITLCRIFNTYGPRETNPHIIPEIIRQLRQKPDELLLGKITTVRDLIYVSDTAEALIRLGRLVPDAPRTVNVSSAVHATMKEVVEIMGSLLGRPLPIRPDPARLRKIDKNIQRADISRLQQLTGWRPGTDLRTGLRHLLEFEGLM